MKNLLNDESFSNERNPNFGTDRHHADGWLADTTFSIRNGVGDIAYS